MLCPKCGWTNTDDSSRCANCEAELAQPIAPQATEQIAAPPYASSTGPAPVVTDYMAWSIAATALSAFLGMMGCFMLAVAPMACGVVAIVKSSSANTRKLFGDYHGAQTDSASAKTWLWVSAGLAAFGIAATVLFWIFYFGFIFTMIRQSHGFR